MLMCDVKDKILHKCVISTKFTYIFDHKICFTDVFGRLKKKSEHAVVT